MNHAFSLTQGVGSGGGALRVLGPAFAGRLVTTRAGAATVADAAVILQPALANTPRFNGVARRLLVEEARTNILLNPRGEGAVVGSPGTMPTGWTSPASALAAVGLTWDIQAIPAANPVDGVPCLRVRLSGTATGAVAINVNLGGTTAIADGSMVATGLFVRTVSGSPDTLSVVSNRLRILNSSGTQLANAQPALAPGGTLARRFNALPGVSGGVQAQFLLQINVTSGLATDWTFDIGLPTVELAGFASSPILPPAGTTGTSSRAADLPVWTPQGGFGAQGTIVVKVMLPQSAPFGASQGLWQIDDGSDLNRIQLRNTSAGAAITGVVDVAGSTLATLSGGNMAPGTPFRATFTWAAGDQALCLTGGTVQSAAVALPSGLARMLVGHGSTLLNRAANGEVELVDYRPARVSNALLQALANAG
jgi:hypothetical protein